MLGILLGIKSEVIPKAKDFKEDGPALGCCQEQQQRCKQLPEIYGGPDYWKVSFFI